VTSRRVDSDQWICTRRFTAEVEGKRKFATARIGRPRKLRIGWGCEFFISNVGMKEPRLAVGEDQMQAILLAFEGILTTLRKSDIKWRWIYGEEDEIGIPRFVHGGYGRQFAAKLESMIDREIDKLGIAAKRRHYRNLAKRRSRAHQSRTGKGSR
jgi:hypothetical protein